MDETETYSASVTVAGQPCLQHRKADLRKVRNGRKVEIPSRSARLFGETLAPTTMRAKAYEITGQS